MSDEHKCIGFTLQIEYPGCNKKVGDFEPYTTGEFRRYPLIWKPVYKEGTKNKFIIWWLDQTACVNASLYMNRLEIPDYLIEQVEDCYGRSGRGRLWIDPAIGFIAPVGSGIAWDDTHPNSELCGSSAGIVMLANDYDSVRDLGGLFTDLSMNTYTK